MTTLNDDVTVHGDVRVRRIVVIDAEGNEVEDLTATVADLVDRVEALETPQ